MSNSCSNITVPSAHSERIEQWPFRLAPAPSQNKTVGRLLILSAVLAFPGYIVFWLVIMLISEHWGVFSVIESGAHPALGFAVIVALFATFTLPCLFILFAVRKGRRLMAENGADVLRRDRRPPVLLLRSFGDDYLPNPTRPTLFLLGRQRYEEALAQVLNKVGPVVAIGRPNSLEAEIGSARLYVNNDDWKTAVSYFMRLSAAVVIVVGHTSGVWWEIDEAIRKVSPDRLLIFFPYVEQPETAQSRWIRFLRYVFGAGVLRGMVPEMIQERNKRYVLFRERTKKHFNHLPEQLDEVQFLAFAEYGQPKLLSTKRPLLSKIDPNKFFFRLLGFHFLPSYETEISVRATIKSWVENRCRAT